MCDGLCLVAQSCPALCDTLDCSSPGSSVHGDSQGKNTGVGCHVMLCPPPGDLLNPGIELRSPTLLADSLPSGPSGKPKIPSPGNLPDPGIEPGSPALQAYSLPAELPGKAQNCRKVSKTK